jgi:predicted small lipoprotein YifL
MVLNWKIIATLLISGLFMSACGIKGGLYLPKEEKVEKKGG